LARTSVVDRIHQVNTLNRNARTWGVTRALHLGVDIALHNARPIPDGQVVDIEQARVASARGAVVRGALRKGKHTTRVLELEIFKSDVGGVTQAATSTVRRKARRDAGPGFDVGAVAHVFMNGDVAHRDVFDYLIDAVVLTNGADGETEASVKFTIFDEDVCAVCLEGDTVVAIVNKPTAEGDVIRVDGVCAVGLFKSQSGYKGEDGLRSRSSC
jgi:hypothetical protein